MQQLKTLPFFNFTNNLDKITIVSHDITKLFVIVPFKHSASNQRLRLKRGSKLNFDNKKV